MSAPIDIPFARSSAPSMERTSSASSQEKYIPVHRRKPSSSPSLSYHAGTPSSSSCTSHDSSLYPTSRHIPIAQYTPAELLMLATSPLSRISPAAHATISSVAPEIIVSKSAAKQSTRRRAAPQANRRRAATKKLAWVPTRPVSAVPILPDAESSWRSKN